MWLQISVYLFLDPSSSLAMGGYNWQSSQMDTPSFMTSTLTQQMNMSKNNDVEIMSQSDTSSSSSSDEQ